MRFATYAAVSGWGMRPGRPDRAGMEKLLAPSISVIHYFRPIVDSQFSHKNPLNPWLSVP